MSELKEHDITTEAWREYDIPGRGEPYRINSPKTLYVRPNGTTHRVVDSEDVVHCLPIPGSLGCVLRWQNKDLSNPCEF